MADRVEVGQLDGKADEAPEQEEARAEGPDGGEARDPLEGREDLQQALRQLAQKFITEDLYARITEVRDVTKRHLYWRDLQYVAWSDTRRTYFSAAQGYANIPNLDIDDMPRFEFVTNIYQARGLAYIAAISGAPMPIRFFPVDAEKSEDIETAQGFEKLARIIQRWNPVRMLLQEEAFLAWNDGVLGLYTEYVPDESAPGEEREVLEAGTESEPETVRCQECGAEFPAEDFVPPAPCPDCGATLTEENIVPGSATQVPRAAGTETVPKGKQVISVAGALNLRRPQCAKEQADFHYLIYDRDRHYSTLRHEFPDKADDIKPGATMGGADDVFERMARVSVAQGTRLLAQTGGAQMALTTHSKVWFRPAAFYGCDKAHREELEEIFTRGCRVEFAGQTYLRSANESMDDCWVIRHAVPGDGQHRPSGGSSMISAQDRVNTFSNIEAETYEMGIGTTYRDASLFDQQARNEQVSEPGDNVDVNLRPQEDIRAKILQVQSETPSAQMHQSMAELQGPIADQLSGTFPAVTGAMENSPETVGGMAMQRDQSMGRMGIPYSQMKQMHADIMTLACKMFRANSRGKVSMPVLGKSGDFEAEAVDVTALEGDARAYPEGDESFPELWNQKRATMMQIMDTPQGVQLVQEPENAELFARLTGIPELVVPGADAEKKALAAIAELTEVGRGADQSLKMPPDVDPEVDELAALAMAVKRYLNRDCGRKLKRENPQGYANVRNYLLALNQAKAQLAAQQQPAMKPLSESVTAALDKMPPAAQIQILKQLGINVTPEDFAIKATLDLASKHPAKAPVQPAAATLQGGGV